MPGQRRLPYARQVQEGKLTRLWVRASASLPLGWHLAGVMRREIALQWATSEDEWVAVGPAISPEQALANLTEYYGASSSC
jgi:hypothetical protein